MIRQQHIMGALVLVLTLGLATVVCADSSQPTIEQRLQRLEDIEAIRSLMIDYGRALDERDFEAYGKLFAKDGSWKGGMGGETGPEKIAKMVEAGFAKMDPAMYTDSNHVMTSLDIEVNGDTATAWSRWLWVIKGPDDTPKVQRGGHYVDTMVREEGQWKFQSRQAVTEINK